jgi:hypothetical protein
MINAEMAIDGDIIKYIMWSSYWVRADELGDDNSCYRTYTLTVTYDLLEKVKWHKGKPA